MLCGQCVGGYTEDLFTTECRDRNQCQDYWFWPLTIAYVVAMGLYLVFKPPIFSKLSKQIIWFRNQNNDPAEHHSGIIKIVFYFYQVSELLLISASQKHFERVGFVTPVVALFNFQPRLPRYSMGCPFAGLTVVTK